MKLSIETGSQRLRLAALKRFEALQFGMFIHFGMFTFEQVGQGSGEYLSTRGKIV
jgi:hypothetical protein